MMSRTSSTLQTTTGGICAARFRWDFAMSASGMPPRVSGRYALAFDLGILSGHQYAGHDGLGTLSKCAPCGPTSSRHHMITLPRGDAERNASCDGSGAAGLLTKFIDFGAHAAHARSTSDWYGSSKCRSCRPRKEWVGSIPTSASVIGKQVQRDREPRYSRSL